MMVHTFQNWSVFSPILIELSCFVGLMNATYYVIVAEYTSKRHRAKLCISLFYFWIVALLLLALLAYLIRDWRYLLLCSAILGTPGLALWW